ncbi:uncharacterized protein LOC126684858 [Mercurialis annua]|uniref:uncharacterized protein LOC126684858 n=1 Tax=Mercurialis annua TaxID=3986 RepID=UPI00215DF493|nr:uncharacterized protein LOC126684858 [Mercurialis annua]
MPKDRRDRSVSSDRCKASPYPCGSSHSKRSSPKTPAEIEDDLKEWEDARCPVCMEHPHNAVLLICTSHGKGCRPYMCDTSYRHSNCLDQFRKSSADSPTRTLLSEETSIATSDSPAVVSSEFIVAGEQSLEGLSSTATISCEKNPQPILLCPLCRGHVKDWIVMDPARRFMNAKSRSCACETCEFSGTYSDLRKHARLEHPLVRPTQTDPERQCNWRTLERERDIGDLISTLNSSFGEDRGDDTILPIDDGGWLTVFFLIRVFRPGSSPRSNSWSGVSRTRGQLTFRRRATRLWGETHDGEAGSSTRDEENDSSDGGSGGPWRRSERIRNRNRNRNQTTPDQL